MVAPAVPPVMVHAVVHRRINVSQRADRMANFMVVLGFLGKKKSELQMFRFKRGYSIKAPTIKYFSSVVVFIWFLQCKRNRARSLLQHKNDNLPPKIGDF
jgi:hypothetical protein